MYNTKMNTIFLNSKNSKTSDPNRLLLNLADKINLKRSDKYFALSNLNMYYTWKNIKKPHKNIYLKYQLQHEMKNLNYLMDHFLSQIFKIILNNLKKNGEKTVNSSIRLYKNKIENRITFKIKTGYYLELLTPETTELLGSTKIKIKKDGNDENVPPLEISEVLLIHCLIVNINYQQCSKVMYTSVPNKSFVQLLDISPENFIFSKTFDSEFSYSEVCFTDQNSKPLEIKDKST